MNEDALRKENERLKKELEDLQKHHSFLLAALDNLPNPIFCKDENARFLFFNQRYAAFFGMERSFYLGKTVLDLDYLPRTERERYQAEDVELIRSGGLLSYEVDYSLGDGKVHPSFYWSKGVHDPVTDGKGLIGEIVDISKERALQKSLDNTIGELEESNQKLERMSKIDAGTGIYNRTMLTRTAQEMGQGHERQVCGLMADLDHFKEVNDEFGHLVGDEILMRFAGVLQRECRDGDIPIRYGGEEFLVLLVDADMETGCAVAERICRRCREDVILPDGRPLTVSIGVAAIDPMHRFEENLAILDRMLYKAKESGRDCYFY